jgi:hypothetical protein
VLRGNEELVILRLEFFTIPTDIVEPGDFSEYIEGGNFLALGNPLKGHSEADFGRRTSGSGVVAAIIGNKFQAS